MRIGIPKEIKVHEYRVGATPDMVKLLTSAGHQLCVEKGAGEKLGFSDAVYRHAGAKIVPSPADVYACEMVVKVKEPQPVEYDFFRKGLILCCFLHLAAEPELTQRLMASEVVAIAFETVTDRQGHLPILQPMSEIAGRLSIQVGATALQMNYGGRGVLLGGVPGVPGSRVVIIGGGVAGTEAARTALGIGAKVLLLDPKLPRLRELENLLGSQLSTSVSTPVTVEEALKSADLVVGAVLLPGKRAPKVITRQMVRQMIPGSVIVDVSIDQGGCAETSRPTTHDNPTYLDEGVIHYCVTNMPGACARTATLALTNVICPYVLALANRGYRKAMEEDPGLREGLNVFEGRLVHPALKE